MPIQVLSKFSLPETNLKLPFRDSLALLQLEVDDQGRTELFEPELRREFHPSSFNTRMSL